jgi:hypothetical protein
MKTCAASALSLLACQTWLCGLAGSPTMLANRVFFNEPNLEQQNILLVATI